VSDSEQIGALTAGLFRHRQTIYRPAMIPAFLRRKMGENVNRL
jgi:hypothetical protein